MQPKGFGNRGKQKVLGTSGGNNWRSPNPKEMITLIWGLRKRKRQVLNVEGELVSSHQVYRQKNMRCSKRGFDVEVKISKPKTRRARALSFRLRRSSSQMEA